MGVLRSLDKTCDEFLNFISMKKMESFFKIKDDLVKTLEMEFDLESDEYNCVKFFVYESEYGVKHTKIWDAETGEVVADLNSVDALYEYLTKMEVIN